MRRWQALHSKHLCKCWTRAVPNGAIFYSETSIPSGKQGITDTVKSDIWRIRGLAPEQESAQEGLRNVDLYEQQFGAAVSLAETPGGTALERVQEAVRA